MAQRYAIPRDESPLAYRLGVETAAAIVSTLTIAPILAIVDKAVVCNASGLERLIPSMLHSTKMLFSNPVQFMKQPAFLICWGTYAIIFSTANSIQAICERSDRSSLYPKLFTTSAISINLNIAKDRAFARMFGTGEPRPLAYSSMALFGSRNAMTILAAFSLPGIISQRLQREAQMKKERSDFLAQLVVPVAMQVLNTPLHLVGLDIYNRETATGAERWAFVKKEYTKTLFARIGHIFPAYGIGGVLNEHLRKEGRSYLLRTAFSIPEACPVPATAPVLAPVSMTVQVPSIIESAACER